MAIHKPIDLVNRSVTPTDLIWQIRERNSEAKTTNTALNARTVCTKFEIRSLLSSLCDANMMRSGNLGLIAYSDHDEIELSTRVAKEPTELCEAPIYADFWLVVDDSLCVSDVRQ